tara:strand:+ start:51 stop:803 length:753 start_codon:yes stop_codon:yes gene_type:complete
MFKLKKVEKARKRLSYLTSILFKLFQISIRYKESRDDYGIEIFEYFYLPWKSNKEFNEIYSQIKNNTLNPKSRLFTLYEYSKIYLNENSSFIEVGTWKGGVCGLISLANEHKNIDIFACDTFTGVKNASEYDSFFKNNEYSDASIVDLQNLENEINKEINIIEGIFPSSFEKTKITKPLSMAHIDVDTYFSGKNSFETLSDLLVPGGLIILDDYGGWFTDGITTLGNEIKKDKRFFSVSNHLGQLLIFKR